MAAVMGSVLDMIGNTPIVDVSALSPNPRVRILAKLEGQNPGGSVKDRIALAMIEEAEKDGIAAARAQTILEPSSGNTGIALAMIAKIQGYPLKIVLPENVSVERRQLLEVFGAEIIVDARRRGLERRGAPGPGAWPPSIPSGASSYQYGNAANPRAHYEGTGPEIWRDCPEITHFVAGLGTSGTLMGVGRFLKEQNPDIQVWPSSRRSARWSRALRNLDEGFIPPVLRDVATARPARRQA